VSARRARNAYSADQSACYGQRGIAFISKRPVFGGRLSVFNIGRREPVFPGRLDESFKKFYGAGQAGSDQCEHRIDSNGGRHCARYGNDRFVSNGRDRLKVSTADQGLKCVKCRRGSFGFFKLTKYRSRFSAEYSMPAMRQSKPPNTKMPAPNSGAPNYRSGLLIRRCSSLRRLRSSV